MTERRLWVLAGLLLLEAQWLARAHPAERGLIRELVGLPVLKVGLTFAAVVGLYLALRAVAWQPLRPLSWQPLLLHGSCFLALHTGLGWWSQLESHPLQLVLLAMTVSAWLVSWLLCLHRAADWPLLVRRHIAWLLPAAAASIVIVSVADKLEATWKGALLRASFAGAGRLLRLAFEQPLVAPERTFLGAEGFVIEVTETCSGYEGIALIGMFALGYLWLRREELRFPDALWLLPLGVATSWVLNCFRLALLVFIGARYSPRLAFLAFHSNAGWVAFTLLAVFLVLLVDRKGWFHREKVVVSINPAEPFLAPILSWLFLSMLAAGFQVGLDLLYPSKVLVTLGVVWHYREAYGRILKRPQAASVSIGIAVYVLWVAIVPVQPGAVGPEVLTGPARSLWTIFRFLGAAALIPLVEELAFRGYLLRRLQAEPFERVPQGALTVVSVLASSLAFAVLHQQVMAGFMASLLFAAATSLRGGLSNSVVAHSVTNLLLGIHVLVWQRWDLWG